MTLIGVLVISVISLLLSGLFVLIDEILEYDVHLLGVIQRLNEYLLENLHANHESLFVLVKLKL